jgi:hypothetical protein
MDKPTNRPSIDSLRETQYMKLLEYAALRANRPFSRQNAIDEAGILGESFDTYVDVIYTSTGSDQYAIQVDTLPKYIAFREFEEAVISATEAKAEAKTARTLAVVAIVLSAALALLQFYFQVAGTLKLDAGQVNQLVQASQSIEKSESNRLDALNSKLDETNKALLRLDQNQTELLNRLKPKAVR